MLLQSLLTRRRPTSAALQSGVGMRNTAHLGRVLFVAALLGAATTRAQDAGVDAGLPQDAGPPVVDAGEPPIDAGQPPVDAGQPPVDAGQPPVDAGQPPVDAGDPPPPPEDAGDPPPPPEDAGDPPPPPEDAGDPPPCDEGCQDAQTLIACGAAGPVEIPCSPGFVCQVDACVIGTVDGGPVGPGDAGVSTDGGNRPDTPACVATCIDDRRLGVCSASGQVTPVPCATNETCNNDACVTAAEDGLDALGCNCGAGGKDGVAWTALALAALAIHRRRRAARVRRFLG